MDRIEVEGEKLVAIELCRGFLHSIKIETLKEKFPIKLLDVITGIPAEEGGGVYRVCPVWAGAVAGQSHKNPAYAEACIRKLIASTSGSIAATLPS